jgi:hypothetical protein
MTQIKQEYRLNFHIYRYTLLEQCNKSAVFLTYNIILLYIKNLVKILF